MLLPSSVPLLVEVSQCLLLLQVDNSPAVFLSLALSRVCTGSMDNTCILWDAEAGVETARLEGHGAEIVSLHFSPNDPLIVTGSFDHEIKVR